MVAMRASAPSGTVTFLFTDIEGSTRRWEEEPDAMQVALAAHDEVVRTAIEARGGWLFKHTGPWLPIRHRDHHNSSTKIGISSHDRFDVAP